MAVLILLPFLTLLGLLLLVAGLAVEHHDETPRWPQVVLWAAAIFGLYLALTSEFLSLLQRLNRWGIGLAWLTSVVFLAAAALRTPLLALGSRYWHRQLSQLRGWDWREWALASLLGLEMGVLLVVALAAAPNTADSLLYHMSRVAHWAQNESLRHYASVYHHQLWSPIFSEVAILHFTSLWGSDQLANLVQWFSMVGALVAVVGLTQQLGGGRVTQLLAAALAFSPPMALLQATSTQTDYVVGFWCATSLYFLVRLARRRLGRLDWLALGAATGLGMLSKVTFFPYMGLLLIVAVIIAWHRREERAKLLLRGLTAAGIALLPNLGFWARNLQTYGTPLGAREMLAAGTNLSLDPRTPLANGLQHLALNYVTPWDEANAVLVEGVRNITLFLGQSSAQFQVLWGWNHEDLAGNPLHATLLLIAIAVTLVSEGKREHRWYAGALMLAGLAFAWTVDSGIHRVRYQIPLLLMGAPLTALAMRRWLNTRLQLVAAFGLLSLALPWLLFNESRPAIGWRTHTRTGSVFNITRAESLFANATRARQPFSQASAAAVVGGCQHVGLSIDAIDLEYAFWWLLQEQDPAVEIRVVQPLPELRHLVQHDFDPCAVICTICEGEQYQGLPLQDSYGPVRVYRAKNQFSDGD